MARNEADGRLGKLITTLKKLIEEGTNFKEIGLKYKALTSLATNKHPVSKMLGKDHWQRLQELLDEPAVCAVLEQPRTKSKKSAGGKRSKAKTSSPAGA